MSVRAEGVTGPHDGRDQPVAAVAEVDPVAVAEWLRAHAQNPGGFDGVPEVSRCAGGTSNRTYLLRFPERAVVLRRPHPDNGPAGLRREYDIQAALSPVFGYVPAPVAFCDDESVIGAPFSLTHRLTGRGPGRDLTPAQARGLGHAFVDRLADLHRLDIAATGLDRFDEGPGYVARQVAECSRHYRAARTRNVGSFEKVMAWLADHQPEDQPLCVTHNDFRLDNLVLYPDNPATVVGMLDWETATIGDPLLDLGCALAYWIEPGDSVLARMFRHQPSDLPGMPTRAEIVAHYAARTGRVITPEQWWFYEVFGLFRLATRSQRRYHRYYHGEATDPTHRPLSMTVLVLEWRCTELIRKGPAPLS